MTVPLAVIIWCLAFVFFCWRFARQKVHFFINVICSLMQAIGAVGVVEFITKAEYGLALFISAILALIYYSIVKFRRA